MQKLTSFIEKNPILRYTVIVIVSLLMGFNYQIFIFPNEFAPSGLNGIMTMVQSLFGVNIGYTTLLANIPLLAVAYKKVGKEFAIRTFVHVVLFSGISILLGSLDFSSIRYVGKDSGDQILASVAAGVVNGFVYSVMLRLGACTGGVDIIAAMVNKKRPDLDIMWIIFAMNAIIVAGSFFVYGMTYRPVLLCIIYCFVTSRISSQIVKGKKASVKFEIVTTHPQEIADEIFRELKHGVTFLPAKGMYSGADKAFLVCLVNRRQIVDFEKIVKKYDSTFVIISSASEVVGNFKQIK